MYEELGKFTFFKKWEGEHPQMTAGLASSYIISHSMAIGLFFPYKRKNSNLSEEIGLLSGFFLTMSVTFKFFKSVLLW